MVLWYKIVQRPSYALLSGSRKINSKLQPNLTTLFVNLHSKVGRLSSLSDVKSKRKVFKGFSTTVEVVKEDDSPAPPLTKETARTLIMKLTNEERNILLSSIQEFDSEELKAQYKGQLAAFRWRSKFGRPSKVPRLGDVDPTGSYCPVPEDWLLRKYAETIPKPTGSQLFEVAVHNAVPFVGFGFLDNFFMIICGDSIELTLGCYITLTTMAAAALGNTLSDVLGIGSAWYVENIAAKIGVRPPPLSPIQLDMKSSRICANLGRTVGITIGCLLGMVPLLFMHNKDKESGESSASSNDKTVTVESI